MLVYPSYANTGFRKGWCRFCDNSPPFANNQNSKNSNMSFLDSKSYPTKYKPDTVRFCIFSYSWFYKRYRLSFCCLHSTFELNCKINCMAYLMTMVSSQWSSVTTVTTLQSWVKRDRLSCFSHLQFHFLITCFSYTKNSSLGILKILQKEILLTKLTENSK